MTTKNPNYSYLKVAIESLAAQTYQDFELVFVGDRVAECLFVEDYAEELGIIRNIDSDSRYVTRTDRFKAGVDNARGTWIVVLDHDDLMHPDALWTIIRCLDRFPLMNFFSGAHVEFENESNWQRINRAEPLAQTLSSLQHTFKQRHCWGFRNDPDRWPPDFFNNQYDVEDYWMFANFAKKCIAVLPIPHVLYGWRRHTAQWTFRHRTESNEMCERIQYSLRYFAKKQSPMWFYGDLALATRLLANSVALEEEVKIGS